MDIRVGSTPVVGSRGDSKTGSSSVVEARILAVRAPRRRRPSDPERPQADRRQGSAAADPVNGKVLVLLIPDGSQLPQQLESGAYRVFLRFARR